MTFGNIVSELRNKNQKKRKIKNKWVGGRVIYATRAQHERVPERGLVRALQGPEIGYASLSSTLKVEFAPQGYAMG